MAKAKNNYGFHLLPGLRIGKQGVTFGRPGLWSRTLPFNVQRPAPAPAGEREPKVRASMWGSADRAFKQGYDLLQHRQYPMAAERFRTAIARDPHYADAYLGLLRCGAQDEGLLEALHACSANLRRGEQRFDVLLPKPTYVLLCFAERPIVTAADARYALAADYLAQGRPAEAQAVLGEDTSDQAQALRGNLALSAGQSREALSYLRDVVFDGYLEDDRQALLGTALADLGLTNAAERSLNYASRSGNRACGVFARYQLALLWKKDGRESRARSAFEDIYAECGEYLDVAEHLGLTVASSSRHRGQGVGRRERVRPQSQSEQQIAELEELFNLPAADVDH